MSESDEAGRRGRSRAEAERKPGRLTIRLGEELRAVVDAKTESGGFRSRGHLARHALEVFCGGGQDARGGVASVELAPADREAIGRLSDELRKLGVNLNQVTLNMHRARIAREAGVGHADEEALRGLAEQVARAVAQVNDLVRRLTAGNRNAPRRGTQRAKAREATDA